MTGQSSTGVQSPDGQPLFTTTHWSVVLAAARPEAPEAAAAGKAELIERPRRFVAGDSNAT
jgi:hypothetical protein